MCMRIWPSVIPAVAGSLDLNQKSKRAISPASERKLYDRLGL